MEEADKKPVETAEVEKEAPTKTVVTSTPTPKKTSSTSNSLINSLMIPFAIIIAGGLIGGAVIWSGKQNTTTGTGAAAAQQQQAAPKVTLDSSKMDITGDPYIGQADAPVTMIFWSDYQCPFCKAVEVGGIPQIPTPAAFPDIIKNYVDTGKVKIVFKDFPFLGQDSITGAEYARAVWKLYPKQYFDWRTAMFKAQDQEGDQGFGNAASIDKLDATIPGLDATKIAADVKANAATYQKDIMADRNEASQGGISGTPATVIGTQFLNGAVPYAAFANAIDAALAAAGAK